MFWIIFDGKYYGKETYVHTLLETFQRFAMRIIESDAGCRYIHNEKMWTATVCTNIIPCVPFHRSGFMETDRDVNSQILQHLDFLRGIFEKCDSGRGVQIQPACMAVFSSKYPYETVYLLSSKQVHLDFPIDTRGVSLLSNRVHQTM